MKREPFKNELCAIISSVKAWIYVRRLERELDRIAAGIYTKEEQRINRESLKQ